jgi:hypothetical protein
MLNVVSFCGRRNANALRRQMHARAGFGTSEGLVAPFKHLMLKRSE